MSNLPSAASELAQTLERHDCKVVFAESCTSGLVAAYLGSVPGVSRFLCGSMVVYQDETKIAWLEIDPSLIGRHTSVSAEVTRTLARNVLTATQSADFGCAVTGHLGPNAPMPLDGKIFVAIAARDAESPVVVSEVSVSLTSRERVTRQNEAAVATLEHLKTVIETRSQP